MVNHEASAAAASRPFLIFGRRDYVFCIAVLLFFLCNVALWTMLNRSASTVDSVITKHPGARASTLQETQLSFPVIPSTRLIVPPKEVLEAPRTPHSTSKPENSQRRLAFVTVVSTDGYVPGALVLLHTWHKFTTAEAKIDTIALVVDSLTQRSQSLMREMGWILHPIRLLRKSGRKSNSKLAINFTKLKLWSSEANLTQYDQILYIDSDAMLTGEMYSALDSQYLPFSAVPNTSNSDFNSGVFTYKPDDSVKFFVFCCFHCARYLNL